MALIRMEDGALHWLLWLRQRIPNLTWDQFSAELLHRYSLNALMSPFEKLAAVQQTDSVVVYIDQFLTCAAQVPQISDLTIWAICLMAWRRRFACGFRVMTPPIYHKCHS